MPILIHKRGKHAPGEYRKFQGNTKPKGGRPEKVVRAEELEKLASLQCTVEEICRFFGISKYTLYAKLRADEALREAYARGVASSKIALRRKQMQVAVEDGNVQMLIWLGKQVLGQKDQMVVSPTLLPQEMESEEEQIPLHWNEDLEREFNTIDAKYALEDHSDPSAAAEEADGGGKPGAGPEGA